METFNAFMKHIKTLPKKQTEMNIVDNPVEVFKQCGFAESWKNGEKSN